jgi:hypothetical protein
MKKIQVNAHVVYQIRGVKSYKSISYKAEHWEENLLTGLFQTEEYSQIRSLLWDNRTDKDSGLIGITFNFKNDAL